MKSISVRILTLGVACLGSACALPSCAQEAPDAVQLKIDRCVRWMKATIPSMPTMIDPNLFCSGLETENAGGWGHTHDCVQGEKTKAPAAKFCMSDGRTMPGDTVAIGFTSATPDGRDLLAATQDCPNDPRPAGVILYTRTAASIGDISVPAGIVKLIPSRSAEGWKLTVIKQNGEWDEDEHPPLILGTMRLEPAIVEGPSQNELLLNLLPFPRTCRVAAGTRNIREIHMQYGDVDLFVCVRPDQVSASASRQDSLAERASIFSGLR